jgi:hypothetical protein
MYVCIASIPKQGGVIFCLKTKSVSLLIRPEAVSNQLKSSQKTCNQNITFIKKARAFYKREENIFFPYRTWLPVAQ